MTNKMGIYFHLFNFYSSPVQMTTAFDFRMATSADKFSKTNAGTEAKVFYMLALNEPLVHGRYSNKTLFDVGGDSQFTSGEMNLRIVLQADGYDLDKDFMYDDIAKCLDLMELIHFKAGEPDKSTPKSIRDRLYTDAYGWILNQTDCWEVGMDKANEFTKFVLEYTGFDSINTMRDFIDLVYLPVEFLNDKIISREKQFGIGLLINDGLSIHSSSIRRFISKQISILSSNLRNALLNNDYLLFNDSLILLNRLIYQFPIEDSSRPGGL